MKKKHVYFIIGLVSLIIRLLIEYQNSLIPGINGGYYLVQIRSVLENGKMVLPDMPFVFYVNAFFIKIASFLFSDVPLDTLIINSVKVFGVITIPLLLIPLYYISNTINTNISKFFEFSLVAFCLLSFSPIELGADYIKNALGLSIMTWFIYHYFKYIKSEKKHYLITSLALLFLIAITHFGTFTITVLFFIIGLVVIHKRKSIIPIVTTGVIGFLIILIFDPIRAERSIYLWRKLGIPYALTRYPEGIINLLFSFLIIALLAYILKTKKNSISNNDKPLLWTMLLFIMVLSFPLYDFSLTRRLMVMMFIPQTIGLLLIFKYLNPKFKIIIPVLALFLTGISLLQHYNNPKQSPLTEEAYQDLSTISNYINNPDKTIIFMRHGVEWWVIWKLKTKMAHTTLQVDDEILSKYDEILFLSIKNGANKVFKFESLLFSDPIIPKKTSLLYTSKYYNVFKYLKN